MTDVQSLFIIWNAILNQSQDAKKTLDVTLQIMEKLGLTRDFSMSFYELDYDSIYSVFCEKPKPHRFYKKMAYLIYQSVEHIWKNYEGIPRMVFSSSNKSQIVTNLLEFKGIGEHKAEVAYMFFDIYNNRVNNNYVQCGFQCPALYETLEIELEILERLA